MKELRGRTAVITGAASGIGLGMATRFAEEGMNVVLSDIEHVALDRALKGIESGGQSSSGAKGTRLGKVIAVRTDVSSEESVKAMHDAAIKAFGKVHVVCANAGVVTFGSVWQSSLDEWKWVLNVNLWGVIHTLRAFIPGMLEHGEEGHIVVTTSASGLAAWTSTPYTASKFAGLGITEGLELELKNTPIGVTALNAGAVKTGILNSERNRPADLPEHGTQNETHKIRIAQRKDPNRTDQMSPADMADQVVRAIRDRDMYIMPSQEWHRVEIRKQLQKRLDALKDRGT